MAKGDLIELERRGRRSDAEHDFQGETGKRA